jgi:hypothetical protein
LRSLLTRVIDFYHTTFAEDLRAWHYLQQCGIIDKSLSDAYQLGFANGTLLNVLPPEGEIPAQLKTIGILNSEHQERLYGRVTFPLYDCNGDPADICGLKIGKMAPANQPEHLYLPESNAGLFNRQAARSHKEIILTSSVLDCLTLIDAGIKNSVFCHGNDESMDDYLAWFKQCSVESVFICIGANGVGQKTAAGLGANGFHTHGIDLGDSPTVNAFFKTIANPVDAFKELLHLPKKIAAKENHPLFKPTDWGLRATFSNRRYEVRGIVRSANRLKATVKGIAGMGAKLRFHVDTVDLYSARSRTYLVNGLCDLFGTEKKRIIGDLQKLTEAAEQYEPPCEKPKEIPIKPAERKKALGFLKNLSLLDELLDDFEVLGYTGERMNKLLCYIAAVSRKMDEPLSVMIQSRSAAGKSYLQDTVLSLIPENEVIKYTRLTDQALFYQHADSLRHKILAIEELDGMDGAIYSIRSIQSSKKITIGYTGKDAVTGKPRTEENTVNGPLMVFITTTAVDIDGETANRFIFVSIDESQEMTKKILVKQRQRHTMAGMLAGLKADAVINKHRNANRLLKPVKVVNPYAELLTFSPRSLRARRDHIKYLNLISAITFLFQYQRKRRTVDSACKTIEYITVTLSDIAKANEIAGEVLGRSLGDLNPSSRKLLFLIKRMIEENGKTRALAEYRFSRRQIREYSGWSDFQVRTHIRQLSELEYLYTVTGRRGKEYVYELVYSGGGENGSPFLTGLIDMAELKKRARQAGIFDDNEG